MEEDPWHYPLPTDNNTSDWEAVYITFAAAIIVCGLVLIGVGVFNG